jgi:hypothetical protein
MPQPAPTPPPAPIQPAPAPTAVVNLPDGPLPLEGLPRNAQELRGIRARREILRDQLERATNRRAELVAQIDRDGPAALRVGTQQRLTMLDDRILQIEREQAMTERLLANAPPSVLAQTSESPPRGATVDEDEAVAGAFGAFFFGIVLTLVVARVRRRLMRRRGGAKAAPAAASALADDPRFERLTQAVDAMAEEVERIGEGQRFVTQLLAERREPAALSGEPRR